jgi:hypothetical protein
LTQIYGYLRLLDSRSLVADASSAGPTGEEGEELEQEVKGVKLFVKRGNKPFASGMVGHLKLLSDRNTKAERLRES